MKTEQPRVNVVKVLSYCAPIAGAQVTYLDIANAADAVAEYIAANDAVKEADDAYNGFLDFHCPSVGGGFGWPADLAKHLHALQEALMSAKDRHAAAHARMKGEV